MAYLVSYRFMNTSISQVTSRKSTSLNEYAFTIALLPRTTETVCQETESKWIYLASELIRLHLKNDKILKPFSEVDL